MRVCVRVVMPIGVAIEFGLRDNENERKRDSVCVHLCVCATMLIGVAIQFSLREKERERKRERDKGRERESVCGCVDVVYTFMCMYMYRCIHACVCTGNMRFLQINTDVQTHIQILTYIQVHAHMYPRQMYAIAYKCINTYIYIYRYMHMCILDSLNTDTYIYI